MPGVSNVKNQPTGHGPKGWIGKAPSASLRIAVDMLLTHASHPDPFEANRMPPTYDSMHQPSLEMLHAIATSATRIGQSRVSRSHAVPSPDLVSFWVGSLQYAVTWRTNTEGCLGSIRLQP